MPPRLPDSRLLEDLLRRFAFGVPLHGAPESPRGPDAVLDDFAENGTGTSGAERAEAFTLLAGALGFDVACLEARTRAGAGHQLLSVAIDGRRFLADPAFPLPVPLPLDGAADEQPTGYGRLLVRHGDLGPEVWLDARGDEKRLYTALPGEPGGVRGDGGEHGRTLFRLLEDRFLRWRDGVLEVADAWSRLVFPLPSSGRDGLEAFFPWPLPAWLDDVPADAGCRTVPELRVYDASPLAQDALRRRLADPAHGGLLRGPEGGPSRRVRLEARPRGTRVTLSVDLSGPSPFPSRGLAESARKTLVFQLAQDLFALSAEG